MLSNWLEDRDTILAVKAKMTEMDTQLTSLDNTFSWNCMAGKSGHVGLGECGSGITSGVKSRYANMISAP